MNCTRSSRGRRATAFLGSVLLTALAAEYFGLRPTASAAADRPPVKLTLHPGDHVAYVGNTLADRMQHDGWLETLLQSRFPGLELVFRNLGFSGDELTLRLRSQDFGSPDKWLTDTKADVVFAFFGYNESFAGEAGLEKFKKDLAEFIEHTRGQRYNGKSAPQVVVFSPIAFETPRDRNLPDGSLINRRLEAYTAAMEDVARAHGVPFVDLLRPSHELYARSDEPLTINGVHLTEKGNKRLAEVIDRALFPDAPADKRDPAVLEKVRRAVLNKNFCWFNRYRTVDGYSIYGGRADLKFVDGQTNRVVAQREMEVLDVMTANRDKRIWAVARGGDLKVDDSNTPPFIPVKTNKPGAGPNGEHLYLSGEEAISKMTVAKGMKVTLFASEKEFPELAKPVQMAFDAKGRLWVAAWPSYPHWKPGEEMNDKLLILEDTDGDGKADKCTVFADHLHCPTGFEFYNGGVLVAQAPDLMFLKDSKGGDKADVRLRVLSGLDSADTHHTANSFALDPGGAMYFQEGTFHHTQVETPYGPPLRNANAGVYRYEPRTQKFDAYVTFGFANPHGHAFDHWGQDIVVDGTGANPYHAALFSGRLDFPQKHKTPPQVYKQRTRPCPGMEFLSSRHFPEDYQGNLLVANVIGFQGILQYRIADKDSSFIGFETEPILSSTDPNFRPSDVKIGPDGAIWFIDWHNPIIGHMQHNLRDPSRDRTHGRVYRVTYEGRPLLKPVPIAGEPIDKLLDLLKEPEDRVRSRVKIELGARDSDQVIAAVKKWVDALDQTDPNYAHNLLEALWVHQYHNVVDEGLLKRVLDAPFIRARAAAARVLCYWRDRVPDALEIFKKLASDRNPRVRLEAVRAASFFPTADAIEIVLRSTDQPSDIYLDFVRGETMRALDPHLKAALAAGREFSARSPARARILFRNVATDDLLRMKRSQGVNWEILTRRNLRDEQRHDALTALAKTDGRSSAQVLLEAIRSVDAVSERGDQEVLFDLVRLMTDSDAAELQKIRDALESIATNANLPVTRQLGYVALIAADRNAIRAWALASHSTKGLIDIASAMPLIRDPGQREALYPEVEQVLHGPPYQVGGAFQAFQALQESQAQDSGLRETAMIALTSVRGREAQTFKTLAALFRKNEGDDRQAAITAIVHIPSSHWPTDDARLLLDDLLAYLRILPAKVRTNPRALDAMQLADGLANFLPAADGKKVRAELAELGVRVIRLSTVPDQMRFDLERIVVKAGKPAEILFENTDLMPHNFAVTQPGALEEVGTLAEATATQPGAADRQYVPPSDKILFASKLIPPRGSQRVPFTAPTVPGVYPFVCTYPGHWRRMYGALYVVADLDGYLADPEGYLARNPLPPADDLLKFNRPRKEWTLAELTPGPADLSGRSFATGKQMFTVASCVACHKLNGVGNEFGPDLTKLDPKLRTPAEVLHDVLDPSFRINEKFQSWGFETASGKTVSGLVLEETGDAVKLIENPLTKAEPLVLKKSDIVERKKLPTSIMPKGLLDKLTRDEILDLVAYVVSGGDPTHPMFGSLHKH
jgi:putative heme-binding domain-containing protein